MTDPLIHVVWDAELLSEDDYADLIVALGDVVREQGGVGIERIKERAMGDFFITDKVAIKVSRGGDPASHEENEECEPQPANLPASADHTSPAASSAKSGGRTAN